MPRKKTNKVKLTLTVDKNLMDSAKEMGSNVSSFLEYQLRQYLSLMKHDFNQFSFNNVADPPGFEPGIYGLEGRRSIHAEPRAHKWTGGDLNPRPPPCQGGALPD